MVLWGHCIFALGLVVYFDTEITDTVESNGLHTFKKYIFRVGVVRATP